MQPTLPFIEETITSTDCHDLPDGWSRAKLGEVAEVQTGPFGSQLHASDYAAQGIPVIMPSDLNGGHVSECNIARIPHRIAFHLKRHCVTVGDIVLARRGDIGRAALIGQNDNGWICGTGCLRVRPYNTVNSKFVFRLIARLENIKWLTQNAVGQTMLNLSASVVAQLPILLPPFSEQAHIVEILDTAEAAVSKTEKLIEAKMRYKRALAEQLLTGKRRFPEFKGQVWREAKLGDFFLERSRRHPNNVAPVVLSCSKLYGILPQSERFSKQLASVDQRRYKYVEPGDLVFDPMLLWDASISFTKLHGVVSPAYCTLQFTSIQDDWRFFHHLLYTAQMRYTYKSISKGTNTRRKKVLSSDFLNVKVQVPCPDEQHKIADVLGLVDEEIALLRRQLEALKKQKLGLMQKLLTGQVRV